MRRSALQDLALGARLASAGGRQARVRALMTAVGVGLGVMVLLLATAVPTMIDRENARDDGRTPVAGSGAPALLLAQSGTDYHGKGVRGRDVAAVPGVPVILPPGVRTLPAPGTMVVSPKLAELLRSGDGALLRARLGARVVGTIGDAGLRGPQEYAFYRGASGLRGGDDEQANAMRVTRFGEPSVDTYGILLKLLITIAVVVLLMPIAVFVGTAVRFGGEDRDRRLAALRLVGADRAMAGRIAAGEALLGAVLGLVLGGVLFLLARVLAERVQLQDISVFASDVRPNPVLAVLAVIVVPVAAVGVSLVALRRVVVEPLGVVRREVLARRRLRWRVVPAVVGIALIVQLHGNLSQGGAEYQMALGVVLVLIGLSAVLPWVIEKVVMRFRGGPLAWQLAVRRLQMDGGTAARVVSGIAIAVAGAIALQAVFSAAQRGSTFDTGADPSQAEVVVRASSERLSSVAFVRALRGTEGVTRARGVAAGTGEIAGAGESISVIVGGCGVLRELAVIGRRCRDGDSFVVRSAAAVTQLRTGRLLRLGDEGGAGAGVAWRVPAEARRVVPRSDPSGLLTEGVYATPGALAESALGRHDVSAFVDTDRSRDGIERVRNLVLAADPRASVGSLRSTGESDAFVTVRRGIFAGAVAVLVLIGASLLVGALEQLRERRRVLAVLVAFGTRRGTLAGSVFWQAAVPVVLGLVVSVGVGAGLGALLLTVADEQVVLDWGAFAGMAGAGGAVVLLVTLLSMPALWRLMRADGLRTE